MRRQDVVFRKGEIEDVGVRCTMFWVKRSVSPRGVERGCCAVGPLLVVAPRDGGSGSGPYLHMAYLTCDTSPFSHLQPYELAKVKPGRTVLKHADLANQKLQWLRNDDDV